MNNMAVRKREELKRVAIWLRKKKRSLSEISRELNVPKSTLAGWFRSFPWSRIITNELTSANGRKAIKLLKVMSKINKVRFEKLRMGYRKVAKEEFAELTSNNLFIASLMLYAGEGDLKAENSIVRIANTDWRMLRTFKKFLNRICCIPDERIHMAIVLYPDLVEDECRKYWSSKVGIKVDNFHKTQFIKGKHPSNRLKNGIAYVIVCSREVKEKILVWIDLCYEYL